MRFVPKESYELSVILPCLNEEQTVGLCVEEAEGFFRKYQVKGEVLVVDNGSTDRSAVAAFSKGARVLQEPKKGYGNAICAGIRYSRGKVLIIADCDMTYDLRHLEKMYEMLRTGDCDMVIGNRYVGGMEPGSMSLSHKWGVRMLSFCARKRFRTDVYDFHCGLRGMTREAAGRLEFHTGGMEFATEMIAQAARQGLVIGQVPVRLRRCTWERTSKLRTVKDGFRHMRYILLPGIHSGV